MKTRGQLRKQNAPAPPARCALSYLAMKESTLRPASYRVTRIYLTGDRYFRPLHSRGIAEIGRADIVPCLNRIIRESGRVTASRARAALSAFFTWAMKQG